MSIEFFQTRMGQAFYEGTMPRIARALERIAAALEEQNKLANPDKNPQPEMEKKEKSDG